MVNETNCGQNLINEFTTPGFYLLVVMFSWEISAFQAQDVKNITKYKEILTVFCYFLFKIHNFD